jgi:hypothetical protein
MPVVAVAWALRSIIFQGVGDFLEKARHRGQLGQIENADVPARTECSDRVGSHLISCFMQSCGGHPPRRTSSRCLPGSCDSERLSCVVAVQARAAARALFRGIAAAPENRSARPAGFEPVRYRGHAIHQFAIGKILASRDVTNPGKMEPFIAAVYPLMTDETCWFLAADFDKQSWQRDALAFLATCREKGVPAVLERSRSGNGGHVWIFFSEPVPASEARKLGATAANQNHPTGQPTQVGN